MRRWWLNGALVLALGAALAGCPDDEVEKDGGKYYLDGLISEAGNCKRPPLNICEAPPNIGSQTLWYCPCSPSLCNGGTPTAACSDTTNDCRYFADGCLPLGYAACDQNATDRVLGLCGACFFAEAGVRGPYDTLPKVCDQMQRDSGVAKDVGGAKDAPAAQ